MKNFKKIPLLFSILLSVLIAFQATKIISYSNNTLQHHPEWVSGKLFVFRQFLLGAKDTFYSRHLLQRNQLNVNVTYGFNLIDLNKIFQPSFIGFDFVLGANAYLAVLFNKTERGFEGIRVGSHPKFRNMFFRADSDGRFVETKPLSVLQTDPGEHHMELRFNEGMLTVEVDKARLATIPTAVLAKQMVGFRSGLNKCLVKNLLIKDSDQKIIAQNSFENKRNMPKIFLISLVFALFISFVILMTFGPKRTFYVQYLFILALTFYYGFDFYFWSARPFPTTLAVLLESFNRQPVYINPFEERRYLFFNRLSWLDPVTPNYFSKTNPEPLSTFLGMSMDLQPIGNSDLQIFINHRSPIFTGFTKDVGIFPSLKKEAQKNRDFVICFLGTSQTWGAGASREEDVLTFQFHKLAMTHTDGKRNIMTISLSVAGVTSAEILKRYRILTAALIPDLTIVNLSNNDYDVNKFRRNLTELAQFNKAHRVRTVFILEPNTLEFGDLISSKHQAMISVAETHHVPCLDLHSFFQREDVVDSGFIWWDMVHLTSYGQRLAAEFIWKAVRSEIR